MKRIKISLKYQHFHTFIQENLKNFINSNRFIQKIISKWHAKHKIIHTHAKL